MTAPRHRLTPEAATAWRNLTAALLDLASDGRSTPCQGADRALWTSDSPEERGAAAWRCGPCPVLEACGEYAQAARERNHVWAGVDLTTTTTRRSDAA